MLRMGLKSCGPEMEVATGAEKWMGRGPPGPTASAAYVNCSSCVPFLVLTTCNIINTSEDLSTSWLLVVPAAFMTQSIRAHLSSI